jgi:Ca2+/Na+ antiporter
MAKKLNKKLKKKPLLADLKNRTEGYISVFALLLILLTSLIDYRISLIVAIVFIILLAIYKFIKE